MTEPLQPNAIQRLRDALLNENKAAQQESAPMFGWCHPDNYERYSKVIADYFMSPIPNWQQALVNDVMHAYDKANAICVTCLKRPTHCNCEKQKNA